MYVIYSHLHLPCPESESKLGSSLLVLKLNNCFKTHSAGFQNPKNQQRPGRRPTGGAYSTPPDPLADVKGAIAAPNNPTQGSALRASARTSALDFPSSNSEHRSMPQICPTSKILLKNALFPECVGLRTGHQMRQLDRRSAHGKLLDTTPNTRLI